MITEKTPQELGDCEKRHKDVNMGPSQRTETKGLRAQEPTATINRAARGLWVQSQELRAAWGSLRDTPADKGPEKDSDAIRNIFSEIT